MSSFIPTDVRGLVVGNDVIRYGRNGVTSLHKITKVTATQITLDNDERYLKGSQERFGCEYFNRTWFKVSTPELLASIEQGRQEKARAQQATSLRHELKQLLENRCLSVEQLSAAVAALKPVDPPVDSAVEG